MNNKLVSQYLRNFMIQQNCFKHPKERAKMIKVTPNLEESFLCVRCLEDENPNQTISIKRAIDQIENFVQYETLKNNQELERVNSLKQQINEFSTNFNNLLSNIELQIKMKDELNAKVKTKYDKKLYDIQQLIKNYTDLSQLEKFDVQKQKNEEVTKQNLLFQLLILLRNEELIQTCNYQKQKDLNDLFDNSIDMVQKLLDDQFKQLQSLIDQEYNMLDFTQTNKSLKQSKFQSTGSIQQYNNSFVSTFTTSKTFLCTFKFKNHHPTFKKLSDTRLHIPYDSNNHNPQQYLRLALIWPRLQEGPLKPPRKISFSIESQIKNSLSLGICFDTQKNQELQLLADSKPYLFFTSQGSIIQSLNRNNCASPSYQRGDVISLIVSPQTNYIQLVKNNEYNNPYQIELPNFWEWTRVVFAVGVLSTGGGDIQIKNEI